MTMVNAYKPGAAALSPRDEALIARRDRVLGPAYKLFYERPVHFVRGEGVWLYDPDGQRYLDVYNNVACVGHGNRRVVNALSAQAATLNTHTRYLGDIVVDYAERLLSYFPDALGQVMFTCTGSEANDLAVRIAKAHTGGEGFIVTQTAYHGVTDAVAAMSPSLGPNVAPGPNVRVVPAPDARNWPGMDVGAAFAAAIAQAAQDLLAAGVKPAALLVDTIFSSDGVIAAPRGFLAAAAAAIRAAGGLFIADEVQPGFARTGEAMWGFQRHGVIPDLVTMGKPMGNGHPIAALVGQSAPLASFAAKSRYFNTFGGNPVSCAAGMAVLDVLEEDGLLANAKAVGARLRMGLDALATRYDVIGDIRGAGLFIGLDLVRSGARTPSAEIAGRVVNGLRERRVLISATGPNANVLKIRPPLVFSDEHAGLFIDAMDQTLAAL